MMLTRFNGSLMLASLIFVAGCGGSQTVRDVDQTTTQNSSQASPRAAAPATRHANFDAAKRFLQSWGAGEVFQAGVKKALEEKGSEQPGMAELMRRVLADFKVEQFEDIAAGVYAPHLTQAQFQELLLFTESPTGSRFFKSAVGAALSGKGAKSDEMMKEFNADELTQILKFSQSEAFAALRAKLPTINKLLSDAGKKLGEQLVKDYVKRS